MVKYLPCLHQQSPQPAGIPTLHHLHMIDTTNMGEDDHTAPSFASLNLPVLPSNFMHSSGMATPPLQTLASVPFKWEEEPGKPRPCTDIIPLPEPTKCLELPPSRMTKLASPTTVLDWPDNVGRPRFSSLRFFKEGYGSFDSSSSSGSPGSALDLLLGKKSGAGKKKWGFFGRAMRSQSVRKEACDGGSLRVSLSSTTTVCEKCKKVVKAEDKMIRNGSISRLTQASAGSTHIWVSLRKSLKQALPWKSSKKSRKEGDI